MSCQRLDAVEQRISQARRGATEGRHGDIPEMVRGAGALADAGDQQGCMNVVAELEDLAETVEGGQQQGQAQQQPEQQAQAGQQQTGQAMPDTQQPTATAKEQLGDWAEPVGSSNPSSRPRPANHRPECSSRKHRPRPASSRARRGR